MLHRNINTLFQSKKKSTHKRGCWLVFSLLCPPRLAFGWSYQPPVRCLNVSSGRYLFDRPFSPTSANVLVPKSARKPLIYPACDVLYVRFSLNPHTISQNEVEKCHFCIFVVRRAFLYCPNEVNSINLAIPSPTSCFEIQLLKNYQI